MDTLTLECAKRSRSPSSITNEYDTSLQDDLLIGNEINGNPYDDSHESLMDLPFYFSESDVNQLVLRQMKRRAPIKTGIT